MPSKYDKDVRARAVRLVREHSGDYPTEWAAITAVSSRLGMSSETLRKWIRAEKHRFGVAPICRALTAHGITIVPRTYWARLSAAPSKRALWDTAVTEILAGIYEPDAAGRRPPECLYGTVKMWAHLNRQGIPVAKSTVEKIKRSHGWRGVTRAPPGAHHGP